MTLLSIFTFVTAAKHVPLAKSNRKITVSFSLSPDGSVSRPVAVTCFKTLKLPITMSLSQMERVWVSALTDGGTAFYLP